MSEYDELRQKMVEKQILRREVTDERVIAAMREIPRHIFVPEDQIDLAYNDSPLPIGHGQTISQPYIVAFMSQSLCDLPVGSKVMEIGSGCGYQSAILLHMGFEVHSIERISELVTLAEENLDKIGLKVASTRTGNGYLGIPEHAPFDAILVAACAESIPDEWVEQMCEGGLLVTPSKRRFGWQVLLEGEKVDGKLAQEEAGAVRFVPLIDDRPKPKERRFWRRKG